MIALEMVEQIERLLAEGKVSQRGIARLTGVSRGTVNAIAQGKRHAPRYRKREEVEEAPSGPPQRCPGCGGFVYVPCVLCRARAAMAAAPTQPVADSPPEPMRMELTVEQWKRYREFYAQRLQLLSSNDSASPSPAEDKSHEV